MKEDLCPLGCVGYMGADSSAGFLISAVLCTLYSVLWDGEPGEDGTKVSPVVFARMPHYVSEYIFQARLRKTMRWDYKKKCIVAGVQQARRRAGEDGKCE